MILRLGMAFLNEMLSITLSVKKLNTNEKMGWVLFNKDLIADKQIKIIIFFLLEKRFLLWLNLKVFVEVLRIKGGI